ncbi:hypothetical protein BJD12_00610 [Xanthomonas vesicatoria ATCC 35937]|nr:hypothetical protein BI313_03305 [Xanthomonas vesicatoria]APP74005.1 hypothetical protein BJD12_00610 [Xanthomonas vesicatoria ATCC 35937]KTF35865.1 hypothetical protein LMG920_01025 [Xanthomonas vesicatoria]
MVIKAASHVEPPALVAVSVSDAMPETMDAYANASTREASWDPGWQAMARWRGSMLAGVSWLAGRV